jgi:hypothetical protein
MHTKVKVSCIRNWRECRTNDVHPLGMDELDGPEGAARVVHFDGTSVRARPDDDSKLRLLSSPSELRSLSSLSCSRPCVFSPPAYKDDEFCVWVSVCAGAGVCKSGKPTGAAV